MATSAPPMASSDGVATAGKSPLRANASHTSAAKPNETSVPFIEPACPSTPPCNEPAEAERHRGEHLDGDQHAPRAGQAEAQAREDVGQRSRQHDGAKELALTGAERPRGSNPDLLDGLH